MAFIDTLMRILMPILILALIGVLTQLFLLAQRGNKFVKDLDAQVSPLLNKLNDTADRINDDIARMDSVITGIQDVSEKVIATAQLIQVVLGSPLVKVAGISAGVQKAVERFRGKA